MLVENDYENLTASSSEFVVDDLIEKKTEPTNSKLIHQKKMATLASTLIGTLIDPLDSSRRKRYVKRWIYGEGLKSINND
tara:strand:- start:197 stop:436 length:240 start_codon:yes stop_codon:yes gene_type:complete